MLHAQKGRLRCVVAAGVFAATLVTGAEANDAPPLHLEEAVTLALNANDPTVQRFTERAAALEERAVADGQLPDPQLRFGLANWPVDSFDFEQEPMTQIQVGLRQSFPSGSTRSLTTARRRAEAREQRSARYLQELQIVLQVRRTWLELSYWLNLTGSTYFFYNSCDLRLGKVDFCLLSLVLLQYNCDDKKHYKNA